MAHSPDHVLLSRPRDVYWAGFKSDTYRLQQGGWSLSAEQDVYSRRIRLAMKHDGMRMYGISTRCDFDFFREAESYGRAPLEFHMQQMGCDIVIQMMEGSPFAFEPIDAKPQMVSMTRKSIDDFKIFATPLARTQEIIVEPATVAEMLEKIKAMQVPEQAAIRARNRLRESRESYDIDSSPRQIFHAQIISIDDHREAA